MYTHDITMMSCWTHGWPAGASRTGQTFEWVQNQLACCIHVHVHVHVHACVHSCDSWLIYLIISRWSAPSAFMLELTDIHEPFDSARDQKQPPPSPARDPGSYKETC
jgi:hypothetical protein